MNGSSAVLWLGPAIQGGIGVVSLTVMYLLLAAFIKSLDRRMAEVSRSIEKVNDQLVRVASMVAVLIGRDDATPILNRSGIKKSDSGG